MKLKKIKPYYNVVALISSNLFLILTFYFFGSPAQESIIPNNHKLILFPIEVFVPLYPKEERGQVSLYDESDNIIVKKAFIHPSESIKNDEVSNLHLIEIDEKDLIKIINFKGKNLRAFPTVKDSIKKETESLEFTF